MHKAASEGNGLKPLRSQFKKNMTEMYDITFTEHEIKFNKNLRLRLADLITELQKQSHKSAERTLAFRALQTARHWLGEDLAILGAQYPGTTVVDPPADVANRRTGTPCSCEIYEYCEKCNPEKYREEVARHAANDAVIKR